MRKLGTEVAVYMKKFQGLVLLIIVTNLLNFTFQVYLARMLSVANYGLFAGIWTAISTVGLFSSGLQNQSTASTVKAITNPRSGSNQKKFLNSTLITLCGLSLVVFLALNVVSGFQPNKSISILLISVSMPISGITAIALGRILGWKGVKSFLLFSLILSLIKFLAGVIVIPFTQNPNIMILMILMIQFLISILLIRYEDTKIQPLFGEFHSFENLKLALPTVLYWALVFIDVPIFRYHSSEVSAGIYAAVSNFTKIPLIFAASLNSFLLTSGRLGRNTHEDKKYISRVSGILFLFYFFFLIGSIFLGDMFLNLVIGERYAQFGLAFKQVIAYFSVYLFGFFTILNFEKISKGKMCLLLVLFFSQIAFLLILNLTLEEFLFVYSIFPALMTLVLIWRKSLTDFSKKTKQNPL